MKNLSLISLFLIIALSGQVFADQLALSFQFRHLSKSKRSAVTVEQVKSKDSIGISFSGLAAKKIYDLLKDAEEAGADQEERAHREEDALRPGRQVQKQIQRGEPEEVQEDHARQAAEEGANKVGEGSNQEKEIDEDG